MFNLLKLEVLCFFPVLKRNSSAYNYCMPAYCSAFGCNSSGGRDNVIFHHFPRQKRLAAQWTAAVRRKHFRPSKSAVLCSNHFRDSDYYQNISVMRRLGLSIKFVRLKPGAVPSIFAHNRKRSPSPAEKQKSEILAELLGYEVTAKAPKSTPRTKSDVPAGTSLLEHPCMASLPPGTSLLRSSYERKASLPVTCTDSPIPSTPAVGCPGNVADPAQRAPAVGCHGNVTDPSQRDKVPETENACPVSASKFVQVLVRIRTRRVGLQANVRRKKKSHSTQT